MSIVYRVGADENGLGGQLGPLVVTAVLAEVDEAGTRLLSRRLPKRLREDLNDSKALMSSRDTRLGEAWSRVLLETVASTAPVKPDLDSPSRLLTALLRTPAEVLRAHCPTHHEAQCWSTSAEAFEADPEDLARLRTHVGYLVSRGVRLRGVHSEVVCTKVLNANKRAGVHRFMTDLHAMEALLVSQRAIAQAPLLAICGKIGGMNQYGRFFGPLSGQLHSVLLEGRAESRYHFPELGEVRFVRDADAKDPLVMLASLVGKYVRELLMARVDRFYRSPESEEPTVSGYNDPVTQAFVRATRTRRKQLRIVDECFERP